MRSRLLAAVAVLGSMLGTAGGFAQTSPPGQPSAPAMDEMHKPAPAAGPLKITYGDQSAEWTPATLAALPHTTVTVYNEHAKATQTYSGVPLIDLLTKLGVPDKPRGKQFKLYLVAVGSDGYEVVYSLGEVAPDVHDAMVMVADSQDGKPIADDGPLKMVATGEKRPARWVRNLVAVRVLTAE
jgi:Oxidoreductase molybdopterin binding domain